VVTPIRDARFVDFGFGAPVPCAELCGEGVGNDRLTRLAQFEGDDKRWWAKLHAPQDYRDSARKSRAELPFEAPNQRFAECDIL
jgi:hypothetical protein